MRLPFIYYEQQSERYEEKHILVPGRSPTDHGMLQRGHAGEQSLASDAVSAQAYRGATACPDQELRRSHQPQPRGQGGPPRPICRLRSGSGKVRPAGTSQPDVQQREDTLSQQFKVCRLSQTYLYTQLFCRQPFRHL